VDVHPAEHADARARHVAGGGHDRPAPCAPDGFRRVGRALLTGLVALTIAAPVSADTFRIAVFHTALSRAGPGLLLRDIVGGEDAQVLATLEIIAAVDADVILLLDMDHDAGHAALAAFLDALEDAGAAYPHHVAARPNAGRPTGVDLDGDGRTYRARDAHGYGLFSGDGGMAILSRLPIGSVRDFSAMPWVTLPGNAAEAVTPAAALDGLRLHTVAAWDVELIAPSGTLHILASHATPPVFDGPEDRNGLRNADELRFWADYLDGWTSEGPPFAGERFAVMGTFNVDPQRGEGRRDGLNALRAHPRLQDPAPSRPGGGTATADWSEDGPGALRVDYILPSRNFDILSSGVLWPGVEPQLGISADIAAAASDHRLVWVDLAF
jgi:hypothetical protein